MEYLCLALGLGALIHSVVTRHQARQARRAAEEKRGRANKAWLAAWSVNEPAIYVSEKPDDPAPEMASR